jgi:hypothetical protein
MCYITPSRSIAMSTGQGRICTLGMFWWISVLVANQPHSGMFMIDQFETRDANGNVVLEEQVKFGLMFF